MTESYIQGTGRAGCDGKPALALLLEHGHHNKYADKEMLEYQSNKTICRRDFLFRDVHGYLGVCAVIFVLRSVTDKCRDNHSSSESSQLLFVYV